MLITVGLAGGRHVSFDVDAAKSGACFFGLGIRKCGSTMLDRLCRMLARASRVNWVDVSGTFFRNNVNFAGWGNDPAVTRILRPGNGYGVFRNLPLCFCSTLLFKEGRKVLLVRDPRDALVSEYFSNAYSHPIPPGQDNTGVRKDVQTLREIALSSAIDDYVLSRAAPMAQAFMQYGSLWLAPDVLRLKYENVIFEKRQLVTNIARHFGWSCAEKQVDRIVDAVDVRPPEEVPTAFIRKVTPGDHREKLRGTTIDALNRVLVEPLRFFGYA